MALNTNVWVKGRWYGPSYPQNGEPPPGSVRKEFYDDEPSAPVEEPPAADPVVAPVPTEPVETPEPDGPEEAPSEPSEPEVDEEPPPRAGAGSSRANWAAYAGRHGVDVDDEMGRDDIIDACEAASVRID